MDYSHVELPRVPQLAASGSVVRKVSGAVIVLAVVFFATPSIPEGQRPFGLADGQVQTTFGDFVSPDSVLAKRQLRLLNVERQKDMVSDAGKLLALAKELNAEVEAADSGSLSQDQMHKVDQIEKLAKSVKLKMSLTIGGNTITPAQVVIP